MWKVRYGVTIEERADKLAKGIVPLTVENPRVNVPYRRRNFLFNYCTRFNGRILRSDPEGVAFFDSPSFRYVENFYRGDLARKYLFVRSQRYGEDLEATKSDPRPNAMHVIINGLLRSIYIVRLNQPLGATNWRPLNCSCESYFRRSRMCKHMMAVMMVKNRRRTSARLLRQGRRLYESNIYEMLRDQLQYVQLKL
jgi:hypothetical protein